MLKPDQSMDAKICGKMFRKKQDIGTISKYLPHILFQYSGNI